MAVRLLQNLPSDRHSLVQDTKVSSDLTGLGTGQQKAQGAYSVLNSDHDDVSLSGQKGSVEKDRVGALELEVAAVDEEHYGFRLDASLGHKDVQVETIFRVLSIQFKQQVTIDP